MACVVSEDGNVTYTDFMCSCRIPGNEQSEAAADRCLNVLQEAMDLLECENPSKFLSYAVYWMNDAHMAMITSIPADQWAAVNVEGRQGTYRARVECDRIEDGIAAIVVNLASLGDWLWREDLDD